MAQKYDVAGLGNAIVDVIAATDDDFLLKHKVAKGVMTLIVFISFSALDAMARAYFLPL